jgi:hypothetical protein
MRKGRARLGIILQMNRLRLGRNWRRLLNWSCRDILRAQRQW